MCERGVAQDVWGTEIPSRVQVQSPQTSSTKAEDFFVNECLNFDVLEAKKLVKRHHKKLGSAEGGWAAGPRPLNTYAGSAQRNPVSIWMGDHLRQVNHLGM